MATQRFNPDVAARVRKFLAVEQKEPTPLRSLKEHAAELGVAGIYVKDEGTRLGTKAFKVTGVAWAMSSLLAQELGCSLDTLGGGIAELRKLWEAKFPGKPLTFTTCTDGNHGAAVAWAAQRLGQKAVVYMPKGSADARVENVRKLGGECTVTDLNYDDTVDFASATAKEKGWQLLQDTTLDGYYEIPSLIMEGYCAMADEALEQLDAMDSTVPTHIILQAGVGSMASAVLAYFVEAFKTRGAAAARPKAIICEPRKAACMHASAMRGDGTAAEVTGDLETMIAGLACGVPSTLAWPILSTHVDGGFAWIGDGLAGNGMRAASKAGFEAGECGGAGPGLLARLMAPECKKAAAARASLGLGETSRVLMINTEGATDPINYDIQLGLPDVPFGADDFDVAPPLPSAVVRAATAKRAAEASADEVASKRHAGAKVA